MEAMCTWQTRGECVIKDQQQDVVVTLIYRLQDYYPEATRRRRLKIDRMVQVLREEKEEEEERESVQSKR